jgi:hypothetical protein
MEKVIDTAYSDEYDDDDYDTLQDRGEGEAGPSTGTRGLTRSGAEFRKTNEGYYSSIKALKAAHPRIFSKEATLYVIGMSVDICVERQAETLTFFRKTGDYFKGRLD